MYHYEPSFQSVWQTLVEVSPHAAKEPVVCSAELWYKSLLYLFWSTIHQSYWAGRSKVMLHCSCTHASPVIGHVADAASSSQHTSAGMFILMTSCISITHTFVFTQSHSWLCSSSNWKREEKREKRDYRDLNFWLVVQRAVVLETANNTRTVQ